MRKRPRVCVWVGEGEAQGEATQSSSGAPDSTACRRCRWARAGSRRQPCPACPTCPAPAAPCPAAARPGAGAEESRAKKPGVVWAGARGGRLDMSMITGRSVKGCAGAAGGRPVAVGASAAEVNVDDGEDGDDGTVARGGAWVVAVGSGAGPSSALPRDALRSDRWVRAGAAMAASVAVPIAVPVAASVAVPIAVPVAGAVAVVMDACRVGDSAASTGKAPTPATKGRCGDRRAPGGGVSLVRRPGLVASVYSGARPPSPILCTLARRPGLVAGVRGAGNDDDSASITGADSSTAHAGAAGAASFDDASVYSGARPPSPIPCAGAASFDEAPSAPIGISFVGMVCGRPAGAGRVGDDTAS